MLVLPVSFVVVGRPHLIDTNNPNSTNDVLDKVSMIRRYWYTKPTNRACYISVVDVGVEDETTHKSLCAVCVQDVVVYPDPDWGGRVAEIYRLCMSVHGLVVLWMHTVWLIGE